MQQCHAGSSPVIRASGRSKGVLARYIRSNRLADALRSRAFSALTTSPGARACYDRQRARGPGHNAPSASSATASSASCTAA